MAKKPVEPHPPTHLESAMDYAEHERTYAGFVSLTKWTILILAVSLIILYFLVQP